ncbi:MAG: helix-turn-helix transcriptional regulator [Alphaproteobacteria bacterium]|nr:helix-turn-helix transcriptional regulator [Alphaproteobacteria bacterium]
MSAPTSQVNATPAARVIARDADWVLNEFTCHAGPQDRPFEERHASFAMAAVLEGSFQYRCDNGRALLYPGAVMLGNLGACYECGHEHGSGDRCVSLHLSPALFGEIAASMAGSSGFQFRAAMLPALNSLTRPMAQIAALAANTSTSNHMAVEELVIDMAETVVEAVAGGNARSAMLSAVDSRRISRVLRHIEAHAAEAIDLAGLASVACMSKYHFLRSFRRSTGVTPHQYLLGLRLRRAAQRLCSSRDPVSAIAYDAGFGDLSTFNASFRARFGASPGSFRSAYGRLIAA